MYRKPHAIPGSFDKQGWGGVPGFGVRGRWNVVYPGQFPAEAFFVNAQGQAVRRYTGKQLGARASGLMYQAIELLKQREYAAHLAAIMGATTAECAGILRNATFRDCETIFGQWFGFDAMP